MKLVIFDKGGGGFVEDAKTSAIGVFGAECVTVLKPIPDDAQSSLQSTSGIVGKLRQFTHIVCHLRTEKDKAGDWFDPAWPKLIAPDADLSKVQVIIRVSSKGASGMSDSFRSPYRHMDTGPWILHVIESSLHVGKGWEAIFRAVKEWNTSGIELPDEIRSLFDHNSERLALRLLCEAWILTTGKASARIGQVAVHGPTDSADWLRPFTLDDSQKSIEQIAKRFRNENGGDQPILAVLNAVRTGKLTWESRALVEKLHDSLKTERMSCNAGSHAK